MSGLTLRATAARITFGPFEFIPEQSVLLKEGEAVRVGSRAISILTLLTERRGEVVPAREIEERVWPQTYVGENNLRVHIAKLRRILGDSEGEGRYIVNEPGRGYRFTAHIASHQPPNLASAREKGLKRAQTVVDTLQTELIGRRDPLSALVDQLPRWRLLTIIGPGGVGKTSLAIAAAKQLSAKFSDGASFVDLSQINDGNLVTGAIASALRIPAPIGETAEAIFDHLCDKQFLLIFDNCEHVLDDCAQVAEMLLGACPEIAILATSREPLRARGEVLQHLQPLALPPDQAAISAEEAMQSPAVQLFAARAAKGIGSFALTDSNASIVAAICRRLDGLPLALEIGAACAGTIGLQALSMELDDRLPLLMPGRRTSGRHQTLKAVLDWSFDLLSQEEKCLFSRLGVFQGGFTLEGARAISGTPCTGTAETILGLGNLVAKSLLVVDASSGEACYRQLDTTRAYAREKLRGSDKFSEISRLHAQYICDSLQSANTDFDMHRSSATWEQFEARLADIRAALGWGYSEDGFSKTAVSLTIASAPVWFSVLRSADLLHWVKRGLEVLPSAGLAATSFELQLLMLEATIYFNAGGACQAAEAALNRAMALAHSLDELRAQVTIHWMRQGIANLEGNYLAALDSANKVKQLAEITSDQEACVLGKRVTALAHFHLGNFSAARHFGELATSCATAMPPLRGNYRYDPLAAAKANLAKVLWIQGFADKASEVMAAAVDRSISLHDPNSLCYIILHGACPLNLWIGNSAGTRDLLELLYQQDEEAYSFYKNWAASYELILAYRQHHHTKIIAQLVEQSRTFNWLLRDLLLTLVEETADAETGRRAKSSPVIWCSAEGLRANGTQLYRCMGERGASMAEFMYHRSIALAREQGAAAWELRAATSLASLYRKLDRRVEAWDCLAPTFERFSEGFATRDLRAAADLLQELR